MSTAQSFRYVLAAGAAFVGVGLLMEGVILTGVFFLITAVLLLPFLYRILFVDSNEVQLLSPVVFLVVAVFSFAMYNVAPKPYTIPPRVVYSDAVAQPSDTVGTSSTTVVHTTTQTPAVVTQATTLGTTAFVTTATVADSVSTVYRTPSGQRYHFDPDCGGENSYEISFDEAVSAGLTPCKKCAGG